MAELKKHKTEDHRNLLQSSGRSISHKPTCGSVGVAVSAHAVTFAEFFPQLTAPAIAAAGEGKTRKELSHATTSFKS